MQVNLLLFVCDLASMFRRPPEIFLNFAFLLKF